VLVSIPELVRIIEHVREQFDETAIAALRARSATYAAQVEGRDVNRATTESVPCPLLVGDLCSVYEARPLVCRGYNSTDADACSRAHDDPGVLVPTFAPVKDVTDGATVGMAQRLREAACGDAMVDLGTAVHMALNSDAHWAEAVVGGELDLSAAERPSWAADLWALVSDTARLVGVKV
jgi:hypothetical protein